jgi:hypothetical protein
VTVEDRLRATTEAVTAAMRPVRPLDLPPRPSAAGAAAKHHRARSPRRWPGWLVPIAAAVAVIAVAATLVAVRDISAAGPGGMPATSSTSTTTLSAGVPRYFVAFTSTVGTGVRGVPKGDAFVGDTSTGKPLAVFKPPSGAGFNNLVGSSDDRTFALEAVPSSRQSPDIWYVLRLTPGAAHLAQLTRVPIDASSAFNSLDGFAVSPDGGTLAMLFQGTVDTVNGDMHGASGSGSVVLQTYSLVTGRLLRTWTTLGTGSALFEFQDLSWLDDGNTLAFVYPFQAKQRYVRTLDTEDPGSNLIADSQVAFTVPASHACDDQLLMTADGKSVICGTLGNSGWCTTGVMAFTAYSVATGKLEGTPSRYQGHCLGGTATVVWAKSATLAIGWFAISRPLGSGPPITTLIGVITPGKFTSLSNIPVGSGGYGMLSMIAF